MRQNRFLYYLLAQALTIPTIIMIFKNFEDKKAASLLAGTVFMGISLGSFWWEYKKAQLQAKIFWVTGLPFFFFFVLPILLLRLTFWSQNFMEIDFLGIKPSELHRYSNVSFLIWSAGCLIEAFRLWIKNKKALQ